ncbi:MAG TPA: DUF2961 domain-containing protein [Candidatus Latescibacteria bacterium]|nr:DUF2961 domain-containing protein [Candidatus Latescibacterota bacterium]
MVDLRELPRLRSCRTKRVSSYDRTGGNRDAIRIPRGKTATLAEIKESGCITHIWFTIACKDKYYLRKLLLRMYWDGEDDPSVDSPVGDFFGVGHGIARAFSCAVLDMTGGRGNSSAFNCYFPMPFDRSARIEIINECDTDVDSFYYYIDYEEYDRLEGDLGRFHAKWHRENPCQALKFKEGEPEINLTGDENYVILDAEGRGHYVGCNLSIDNRAGGWWGEGDDMIFVDGERWPPSLHGTGSEDYFCSAWGMQDIAYPYHGTSLFNKNHSDWEGKWTVYRYHIPDPIHFKKSIKVTIEHGHANDRGDDYSSVAYWYQTEPHKRWIEMLPVEERLPRED